MEKKWMLWIKEHKGQWYGLIFHCDLNELIDGKATSSIWFNHTHKIGKFRKEDDVTCYLTVILSISGKKLKNMPILRSIHQVMHIILDQEVNTPAWLHHISKITFHRLLDIVL